MKLLPPLTSPVQFGSSKKVIKDYTLLYSVSNFLVKSELKVMFPREGFLIFNFFVGENYEYRITNYNCPTTRPGHLYITGLFSQGSLILSHVGQGQGYSMKIHPVIGYHLLKVPMDQLTDQQIQIGYVLGREGVLLRRMEENHQITSSNDHHLTKFLEKILPDKSVYLNDPIYHAVNAVIRKKGNVRIEKLARQFCMSERTLNRQFLLKVGLSPKAYAKIWQLKHVMELLQQYPGVSQTHVAHSAGYYDAAHLIHDFNHNTSQLPSQFRQGIAPVVQDYLNFPGSIN